MDIIFQDHEAIIAIDKVLLVPTCEQFIEALKRGKTWPRRQAM